MWLKGRDKKATVHFLGFFCWGDVM